MEVIDHSARAHSSLGASSASRWLACPSSVALSEGIVEKESNFAAEGTCAHEVADLALNNDKNAVDYIGDEYEGHVVTKEMADYVQTYIDYVREAGKGKTVSIEERVSLAFLDERMFGSNDAIVYEPFGTLEVIDLKYGKGVEVLPENNKQLMYYALGAAHGGEYANVKMTIVQPRVDNPIKSWTVPYSVIADYAEELRMGVERVDSGAELFASGEHCRFCKAKAICPQQKKQAQELALVDFNAHIVTTDDSLPSPSNLSATEIKNILDHAKLIKDWLSSVEVHALNELEAGREVEGYKLVAGRSVRKLVNPEEFEKQFGAIYGEAIYQPKKLIGVGQLEKLVGKENAKPFLIKPPANNSIAKATDKRREVLPKVNEEFKEFIKPEGVQSFDTMEF
jgi:hypothetical protein